MDTINLIPAQELKEEPVGQFLRWSETAGKVIVVLTEAIVLAVFLARFKLDAQILDLKQEITTKAQLVKSLQGFEGGFRNAQDKIKAVEDLSQELFLPVQQLTWIEESIPQDVFLTNEVISAKKTTLQGKSASYESISSFWQNLGETIATNQEVTLSSLGREETEDNNDQSNQESVPLITFTFQIKPKQKRQPIQPPKQPGETQKQ